MVITNYQGIKIKAPTAKEIYRVINSIKESKSKPLNMKNIQIELRLNSLELAHIMTALNRMSNSENVNPLSRKEFKMLSRKIDRTVKGGLIG